jgi:TBC1 domain family member 13
MSRILFLYARLNPGVMYVQGMNEILATLYFVSYDANPQHDEFFESDLFFCFTKIMSDLRDGFIRTMDQEETGINGKINHFVKTFA